jgi:DNA repair exonuclease SbcCD ATPase subunit
MTDRQNPTEPLLALHEEEGLEHLDSQVQKAQEQLLSLKRQQEAIEKQKRELEELSRRQEQLQLGRGEMVEQFTRALVVLERETYDAQKRVEQLRGIYESFAQHLDILEAINPKTWENSDINKELNKALSAVDDARAEFSRSRAAINADAKEEVLEPVAAGDYQLSYSPEAQHDFAYWLKSGFAFTLPLLILGLCLLAAYIFMGAK